LSSLCAPGNTSRSVTHPEIAPGQARLTPEFFAGGLPKKKLQLGGISMLLILLSRGGCYRGHAAAAMGRTARACSSAATGESPEW
jgi:hypothetical protein